jgi:hypothetical protein
VLIVAIVVMCVGGCASQTIDATNRLMNGQPQASYERSWSQKVKDMIIQANAQAINPAIVISGEGKYVRALSGISRF